MLVSIHLQRTITKLTQNDKQGLCSPPPLAILDFYGPKCFDDKSWYSPLPAFSQMPDFPQDFTDKIHTGPQAISSAPMFIAGAPNLSDPRCAWYIAQIKAGTSLSSIVPDGDVQRLDPVAQFEQGFPNTYFLHGKKDVFVGWELSQRAGKRLRDFEIEAELVLPEDVGHAFDLQMDVRREDWERYVVPALDWLVGKV
jgi:pimeloyl-ACP methyl ester carboxylesterase